MMRTDLEAEIAYLAILGHEIEFSHDRPVYTPAMCLDIPCPWPPWVEGAV